MTVADVIAELQRYPEHMPVLMQTCGVALLPFGPDVPSEDVISEVDTIRFEGSHVLVIG